MGGGQGVRVEPSLLKGSCAFIKETPGRAFALPPREDVVKG